MVLNGGILIILSGCSSVPRDKFCITYASNFEPTILRYDVSGAVLGRQGIPEGLSVDDLLGLGINACGRNAE